MMENINGIKIISESKNDAQFIILENQKDTAISTLLQLIDSGNIITLSDNRDKREGSISLKKENNKYFQCGGGHGFSVNWNEASKKDILWLIKVTAPFNYGASEGDNGNIKKNS